MTEKEREQREDVVKEAITWLGTPYHPAGRVKGAGVDCGMLLAEVFETCGLVEHVDPGYYSPEFSLHHSDEIYQQWIEKYAKRVEREPLPGDIILYQFGKCRSHAVIVIDWPQVIHSYIRLGVVWGNATKEPLVSRQQEVYSVWG